jgi:hypothetical protein
MNTTGRQCAAPELRGRARARQRPARWMVMAFCPLTGPWRQVVHAESAAGALAQYCAEHEMPPEACHVQPA